MSEYMVKYMQKLFYEGLKTKNTLQSNMALEWFNNCGVFIEDEGNILCKDCPLSDCLECKDRFSKEDLEESQCMVDGGELCFDCGECE